MKKNQQTILITGASGFIGSYLVNRIKDSYNLYTLSRRHPKSFDYENDPNIEWIQADIGSKRGLSEALDHIKHDFPIDFIIHLAGFYDFNYDNNPEYERTNVQGTQHVLEQARKLNIKRFIFASSVAACDFPRPNNQLINEKTPPDAKFAYAVSKRKGEEMVKEYSKFFNCTTVRFAAAFSDWCEYGPLYIFLNTWLTQNWKSRILGGKGKSAIPYVHVDCIINLLVEIIKQTDDLPSYDTYIAGGGNSASHKELFDLATRFYYGESKNPIFIPQWLSFLGLLGMDFLGRIFNKRPFERPWMIKYVDKQMLVNNSYTCRQLDCYPINRFIIQRRLLYMIEHMKSYPFEWQKRNFLAMKLRKVHPNFRIYETLDKLRDRIVKKCIDHILDPDYIDQFRGYHSIEKAVLVKDMKTLFQFLSIAVRALDRMSIIIYAREIAHIRFKQNFKSTEVLDAVKAAGTIIQDELVKDEALKGMSQEIYDEINFTFQLVLDEIEGTFEMIDKQKELKSS